ncbi:MAG: methyltransferase domain-containing protein [Deltaproteobacteria bacterium]|nr:methyltransferase domain-containing protein [Deltaproteobacteria bacterium]
MARHAARLLAPAPGARVLDVGSGVGKFCLAAAAEVPGSRFIGVECRGHLVRVANHLAGDLALANVEFIHADALDLDWSGYDAFYFFNPFGEQLFDEVFVLDRTIALHPRNFVAYITRVRSRLAGARIGTRVVTYHGLGAPPPFGFELARSDRIGTDVVELWVKTRAYDQMGCW